MVSLAHEFHKNLMIKELDKALGELDTTAVADEFAEAVSPTVMDMVSAAAVYVEEADEAACKVDPEDIPMAEMHIRVSLAKADFCLRAAELLATSQNQQP